MQAKVKTKRKIINELSKKFTATEILFLLGETLLLEIDEKAEVKYSKDKEPHSFMFEMENGRVISVLVMDVIPAKK